MIDVPRDVAARWGYDEGENSAYLIWRSPLEGQTSSFRLRLSYPSGEALIYELPLDEEVEESDYQVHFLAEEADGQWAGLGDRRGSSFESLWPAGTTITVTAVDSSGRESSPSEPLSIA